MSLILGTGPQHWKDNAKVKAQTFSPAIHNPALMLVMKRRGGGRGVVVTQLAFYLNLYQTVIGPTGILLGR